jgi:hypothetical protein
MTRLLLSLVRLIVGKFSLVSIESEVAFSEGLFLRPYKCRL